MNHLKHGERLAFIRSTLLEEIGLEPCQIEPIQYDPECEFPYNNFVYRVELALPKCGHEQNTLQKPKPGTTRLPENVSIFVIRLSNAAAGLNDVNRVENEVAVMSLFSDALSQVDAHVVPKVYGWGSAAKGQGWIFQEYMTGKNMAFKKMTAQDKHLVLPKIAEIFAAVQQYQLPDTIRDYGGLGFDENGVIVSAPMTLINGGPFKDYEALYSAIIHSQLTVADKSSVLEGWRPNGVRNRLDQFLRQGLHRSFSHIQSRKKALVHGDFTTDNLLFDPKTLKITAILDFDWSYVGIDADEFLRSFSDISGKLPGPFNASPEESALRIALLKGFPNPLPSSDSSVPWEVAKAWDEELERRNIQRPRTIEGIDALSGVFWLSQQICPFLLCNPTVLSYRTSLQRTQDRENAERLLITYMEMNRF